MREGLGHDRHRGTTVIAAEHSVGALWMVGGDLHRSNVNVFVNAFGPDVDQACLDTGGLDQASYVTQFVALGVAGAGDVSLCHRFPFQSCLAPSRSRS